MAQVDYTRIASNIAALNSLNSLRNINTRLGTAQLRLATGRRINQASDDPAGLTIALKMDARNEGLKVAMSNIGDAKNMLAVAESGLQQMNDILVEMKSKATAAASDTLGEDERAAIQTQLRSMARQINDIVGETQWNNTNLLDGTVNKTLQTGAGASDATSWVQSVNHGPVELGVAESSGETATLNAVDVDTEAFSTTKNGVGVEVVESFGGLSELDSGSYKFEVIQTATAAGTGKVLSSSAATAFDVSTVTGLNTFTAITGAASTYELSSGNYSLTIDGHSGATIDYTIRDSLGDVVAAKDGLNAGSAATLVDVNGNALGIQIDVNSSLVTGTKFNFEYIGEGEAKMELYKVIGSSEELVTVDSNGTDDAGIDVRRSHFYLDVTSGGATSSYNTGIGFRLFMNKGISAATVTAGKASEFEYTAAGDVNVDISTSSLASAYMDKVDDAIDSVSQSLNSIGSLVARLDAKEQAVGVAQVNTEAAYNRIMNADMAMEQVEASKFMILQQTAVAMLAQANMAPQGILSLFR